MAKTLSRTTNQQKILERLKFVRPDSPRRWGKMTAHEMICHLSDSFRASLGEKEISPASSVFKRTVFKWIALWGPVKWPHGVQTRPEMDQHKGGTPPAKFAADLESLRVLLGRFVSWQGEYAPHPMLGPLSRTERMRHAYLHMDHHLRQFWA